MTNGFLIAWAIIATMYAFVAWLEVRRWRHIHVQQLLDYDAARRRLRELGHNVPTAEFYRKVDLIEAEERRANHPQKEYDR